jgi:hypothetical protein
LSFAAAVGERDAPRRSCSILAKNRFLNCYWLLR